jgi:hypothetical protein
VTFVLLRVAYGVAQIAAFGQGTLWIIRGHLPLNRLGALFTLAAAACLPLIIVRLVTTITDASLPRWLDLAGFGGGLLVIAWFVLLVLTKSPLVDTGRVRHR